MMMMMEILGMAATDDAGVGVGNEDGDGKTDQWQKSLETTQRVSGLAR